MLHIIFLPSTKKISHSCSLTFRYVHFWYNDIMLILFIHIIVLIIYYINIMELKVLDHALYSYEKQINK